MFPAEWAEQMPYLMNWTLADFRDARMLGRDRRWHRHRHRHRMGQRRMNRSVGGMRPFRSPDHILKGWDQGIS